MTLHEVTTRTDIGRDVMPQQQSRPMRSFHSDPAIKARYLARVEGHAAADEIIKGQYWEAGKGCAVGCTVHGQSHEDFEKELGIPRMLAWLEDVIFEGLPNRVAKNWPERFLSSIEPGRDLSRTGWQLLLWLLIDRECPERDHPTVAGAITQCARVLMPLIQGRQVDQQAAVLAAAAARAAAQQAETGIDVPPRAVWIAESAAFAAESAATYAIDATMSAEQAATSVTAAIGRSSDYIRVSERLIELLIRPE